LETLAGYFSNASIATNEPIGRCSCWLGYCERFPASTKVSFAIEHDVRCETVLVCFEAAMMPLFIRMTEHDRLTTPLESARDEDVEAWVEERLLEFVDSYLSIDRGRDDFGEDMATDPVCGMRISRSSAVASDTYRGHPYFFCSVECQQQFTQKPTAFVEVRTM
jgi:YHS domain-containing protein